jgi:hypothetical protein
MPDIRLPRLTHGTLRAFWLVVSGVVGLSAGLATARARRDVRAVAVTLPVAAVVAVPGLRHPDAVRGPYRVWNRAGRDTGRLASRYLTGVASLTLSATRAVGAPPGGDQSTGPGWTPRSSQRRAAFRQQDSSTAVTSGDALDRFVLHPDRAWARALRPILRVLNATSPTASPVAIEPPTDVYTLY